VSRISRPRPPKPVAEEPFYGWRYVKRRQADGKLRYEEVPLPKEGLLYPEEGDFVVNEPVHTRDFKYCSDALETFYKDEPSVVVLSDCRVDFGVTGIRPLGPDIHVLFGVRRWLRKGTYRVAKEGGRSVLVLEITSSDTRRNDIGIKKTLYHRVGVERYVIVDRGPRNKKPASLIGYERTPTGWKTITPDAQGRLSLAPVPLLIGIEDDRPYLYNAATGERLPDYTEAVTKAREEEKERKQAEAKARRAEAKARRAEAKAAELETRLRELENQLRRRNGQS
jgi:Putative restriction endonuclease